METVKKLRIFFIGFNRCGTTSLHRLLAKSGVNSLHFRVRNGPHLASRMFTNLSLGMPLLNGLEQYEAFSDMNFMRHGMFLEGHRLFKNLHKDYPGAYFILNTRDKERWIASRCQHAVGDGTMVDYVRSIYSLTEEDVCSLWRRQWDIHHREVEEYFEENTANYMRFNIEDDDIQILSSFFGFDVELDPTAWKKRNAGLSKELTR